MDTNPLRVLVVEDYEQTRAGIRDYLVSNGMLVKEASNTSDALRVVNEWQPQVIVLDIVIPAIPGATVDLHHGDGIRAAWLIKTSHPEIGIVLLSNHPYYRPEVLELVSQGYGGLVYLFKGEGPAHELRQAIWQAQEGQLVLDARICQSADNRSNFLETLVTAPERQRIEYALSQFEKLTDRERDLARLVAASYSNIRIAKELIIAISSVQTHLNHIYGKLGLGENDDLDKRALLTKTYQLQQARNERGKIV